MNVLLLALSTFYFVDKEEDNKISKVLLPCSLKYGENDLGKYYYQLEPILLLYKKLNKNPDVIIVMSTQATKTVKEFIFDDQGKKCISEEKFFEERAKELFPKARVIPCESGNDVKTIKDVIKEIRDLKQDIDLTIDIHGGHRDIQILIQNIITLLRYEHIVPRQIYTVNFNSSTRNGIIYPANETYSINQYVMGLNEFLAFGRSNSLEEYYKDSSNEIVKLINNISDAIQLCHIERFDKAIKAMSEFIDRYKPTDDYTDIFIDTIKASFGELMDKKGRNKVINKVKWCVDNDFIQQALTVIESQMPRELYQRKILSYNMDDQKRVKLYQENSNRQLNEVSGGIELSEALKYRKPDWESDINFAIIPWIRENCCSVSVLNGKPEYTEKISISGNDINKYISFNTEDRCLEKECIIKGVDPNRNVIKLGFIINDKLNSDNRKNLARLLTLHLALKNERNGSNHASSKKRPTVNEVKTAIYAYIKLTETILDAVKR